MTKQSTRTFLELHVGSTHTIEVVLHVRHKDLTWFTTLREELLQLLSTRIVPREFEAEIETYHEKLNGTAVNKTGEKNEKQRQSKGKVTGKRKRKTKAPPAPLVVTEKPRRDVRHCFGDNLQLTYRLQDMDMDAGATISVSSEHGDLGFRQYPKLSKRLVVWCFPLQGDATEPDPTDGGFPRPELIPIAALFRQEEE